MAFLILTGCGGQQERGAAERAKGETVSAASPRATPSKTADEILIRIPDAGAVSEPASITLPKGSGVAPVGSCAFAAPETYCEATLIQFRDRDWPGAWRGRYQAMRNVAYCLAGGCGPAVQPNALQGCAWRMVIQISGDPEVNTLDGVSMKQDCSNLDEAGLLAAEQQAKSIFKTVYRRPAP